MAALRPFRAAAAVLRPASIAVSLAPPLCIAQRRAIHWQYGRNERDPYQTIKQQPAEVTKQLSEMLEQRASESKQRQLRAELRCFFKRVVLESDVPSALLNVDRYFNFAVMMTVVHDAAGRMDYHPHMRYQVRCSESARCDARA